MALQNIREKYNVMCIYVTMVLFLLQFMEITKQVLDQQWFVVVYRDCCHYLAASSFTASPILDTYITLSVFSCWTELDRYYFNTMSSELMRSYISDICKKIQQNWSNLRISYVSSHLASRRILSLFGGIVVCILYSGLISEDIPLFGSQLDAMAW